MNNTHGTHRTPEEIMLHYLQLPFKNVEDLQKLIDKQDIDMDELGY